MLRAIRGVVTTIGVLAAITCVMAAVILASLIGAVLGLGIGLGILALALPLTLIHVAVFIASRFVHSSPTHATRARW